MTAFGNKNVKFPIFRDSGDEAENRFSMWKDTTFWSWQFLIA